jgi:hypothetical protein
VPAKDRPGLVTHKSIWGSENLSTIHKRKKEGDQKNFHQILNKHKNTHTNRKITLEKIQIILKNNVCGCSYYTLINSGGLIFLTSRHSTLKLESCGLLMRCTKILIVNFWKWFHLELVPLLLMPYESNPGIFHSGQCPAL